MSVNALAPRPIIPIRPIGPISPHHTAGDATSPHATADGDGAVESASGSDDPQYWYLYDEKWRPIATFRQSDTDPKERFVFHCAGVAGSGSSSYIDAVILRDYDDTYEWNGAGDGSFEQRTYLLQNWRADVVAILDSVGEPLEHVRYSPYGVPSSYPLADVNRDGLVDSDDYDDWDDMFTGAATNAKAPVDLNGDGLFPDTTDYDLFLASYHSTTGMRGGYNKLGATVASSAVISPQNRIGYAGYQWDPAIKQYHVRHRVYSTVMGRWLTRDPSGNVDGANALEYVSSRSTKSVDPFGLQEWVEVPSIPVFWPDDPEPEPRHRCQSVMDAALADPRVSAALASARSACPNSTLPSMTIHECGYLASGGFSCSPGGNTSIDICVSDDEACPLKDSIVTTLIHELTHYKQYCGSRTGGGDGGAGGDDAGGNCTLFNLQNIFTSARTRREIEAYCSQPGMVCPPANQNMASYICTNVAGSGGNYCYCMSIFGFKNAPGCSFDDVPNSTPRPRFELSAAE